MSINYHSSPLSHSDHGTSAIIPLAHLGHAIRETCRIHHYSEKTSYLYVCWARRYVMFHNCRHPNDLGHPEIAAFISHLTLGQRKSPSTQNQALQALRFLYTYVLNRPLVVSYIRSVRAKNPRKLPIAQDRFVIKNFLDQLIGVPRLVAALQYGSGLRLEEALQLRIKDLQFDMRQIVVAGSNERHVPMPSMAIEWLHEQLRARRIQHSRHHAPHSAIWEDQPVFIGERTTRANGTATQAPLHARTIQRAYRATNTNISSKSLRQSFGIHLLDRGTPLRVVQELLGQKDIHSILRYQTVSTQGPGRVLSPLDAMNICTPRVGQLGAP